MSIVNGLKWQVSYIESHEPSINIVSATLFHKRQVFEDANGNQYVLKKLAGWDRFSSLQEAMRAIEEHGNDYLTAIRSLK